ncbi:hypothetical protein EV360DRAFT_88565 [Lentinula raphanica]|nr:hypothetical protein EV360DRAFT_88565 [Lentinula raphanica]
MDSSTIFISDDEDSYESSLTMTSLSTMQVTRTECPTCVPPVYESSSPMRRSGRSYQYYAVFVGDQPGLYRDWADASARVTNYPGNMHKGYDTYEQALAGWRQHCHGFHKHPPGFTDGTMFISPEVPRSPTPVTPPPARINTMSFPTTSFPTPPTVFSPASSPTRTSSPIRPSASTSPSSSHIPRPNVQTPQRPSRIWAIHSPRFNSVVSSSTQADKILARAMEQGEEVEFREVDGVAQAEDWFGSLSLEDV